MLEKKREVWKEILELYKDMSYLWDTSNTNYLNKHMRKQALKILCKKYKVLDENANLAIFKKKLENMRTTYKRELKKVTASMQTGTDTTNIYKPLLWYYDLLSFLNEKDEQSHMDTDKTSKEGDSQPCTVRTASTKSHPPSKQQRINLLKKQKQLYDTADKLMNSTKEEWEVTGKSIGYQMKDLDEKQQAIAQKLISDVLFYAKIGKLTEDSSVSISSRPIYLTSIFPCSTSSLSPASQNLFSSPISSNNPQQPSSNPMPSPSLVFQQPSNPMSSS